MEAIVDPESTIGYRFKINPGSSVGRGAVIGNDVTLGNNSHVLYGTKVGESSFIGDGVIIGPNVKILQQCLIMDGAQVCPNDVSSGSSNARELRDGVSVGPGVFLHDEVELGVGAIVPTQRTIQSIGNFGSKNRVLTIHGSDHGPRISIGCQVSISLHRARSRINTSYGEAEAGSADTYAPYLSVFESIGRQVQKAYYAEEDLVREIKAKRLALFGCLVPNVPPTLQGIMIGEQYESWEDSDHEEG